MGRCHSVEPAHVAGGAGRHEHVARRQLFWVGGQVQMLLLGREHHAMFAFRIDFKLRMVRSHVTLAAG